MTSSWAGSERMDTSESLLARADATFTFRKDIDADTDVVIRRFIVEAAIVGVGTCVLVTRFVCTLSLIFCLNEQGMHVGFGGEVGRGLLTGRRINSKRDAIRQQWVQKNTVVHQIGSRVLGL